jgi:amidase
MTNAPDFAEVIDGLATDLVVSKTVRDTAAALDATAGPIQGDPYWAPQQPKSYQEAM